MPKFVAISVEELEDLLDSDLRLSALEASGVDNWDWYGEALEEYRRMKAEAPERALSYCEVM